MHLSLSAGHPGVRKTAQRVQSAFNWPALVEDVRDYCKRCLRCRRLRPGKEGQQGLFRRHPGRAPFEAIYQDIWGPVSYKDESTNVLTIVDYCTRWAEAAVLSDTSSSSVSAAFIETWISRFGVPHTIITDQAKSFQGCFEEVTSLLRCKALKSTPYHPKGNALVESFHLL
eukprot:GHVP01027737.1.p1 GENE.GHVP01027737.1~~GHVP01027737.1.p1  ORF type:complete len:171 (-),score=8.29 GHVP01027737.1:840-1352(-)